LDKDSTKRHDSFRNSEWGPEAAEALAREVRDFKVPGGKDGKELTMAEYIDRTPSDLISKVMLEEIVFDTWYGGRTVLLGDGTYVFSMRSLAWNGLDKVLTYLDHDHVAFPIDRSSLPQGMSYPFWRLFQWQVEC
jgi:hypothetical protein